MSDLDARIAAVRDATRTFLGERGVDWVLVCGSGLGPGLIDDGLLGLEVEASVGLAELGLPAPEVAGHGKSLVVGTVGPRRVAVQTGRIHPYEGHDVRLGTAALDAALGAAKGLVLTAAVGGLDPALPAGSIVSLRDQMNLFGPTPLRGARFIDCSNVYDRELRARVQDLAKAAGQTVAEAVYAHARGPQYETPAECAALRSLGGDVVGMSTTYEAILGAANQVPCAGLAIVTNAAGAEGLSHVEVQQLADQARGRLAELLKALLATAPQ